MSRRIVSHLNFIGSHINESIQYERPIGDREIFCKRLHKIIEPDISICAECPYFGGLMGGYGHECVWEDLTDSEIIEWDVYPVDTVKEYFRVSKLIDEGILTKG